MTKDALGFCIAFVAYAESLRLRFVIHKLRFGL